MLPSSTFTADNVAQVSTIISSEPLIVRDTDVAQQSNWCAVVLFAATADAALLEFIDHNCDEIDGSFVLI